MIIPRLDQLLETDTRSRWRIIVISALAIAVWGGLASLVMDEAISEAQSGALVFGVVVFSAQVFAYCLGTEEEAGRRVAMLVPRRLVMTAISAATVLLVATVPGPLLEGAIIDRRLRHLTQQKVPLSNESIDQIAEALNEADRAKARIQDRTKEAVRSALKKTAEMDPDLSPRTISAQAALASYSTNSADEKITAELARPSLKAEALNKLWLLAPITTNSDANSYHATGISRQPDVARMERLDNPIHQESDYGPSFLVVPGLEAILDGFNLKRVIFTNTTIVYHGGPLLLDQVYFLNCNFVLDPSPNTSEFVALITSAGPINFAAV